MCRRSEHSHWCFTCDKEIKASEMKLHEKLGHDVDQNCGEEEKGKGKDENISMP